MKVYFITIVSLLVGIPLMLKGLEYAVDWVLVSSISPFNVYIEPVLQ